MKKIAVVAAMEEELEKIQALMKKKKIYKISGRKFIRGKFSGKTIVAVVCGIGKVNCAVTVQILIDKFKVKNIIHTGVAGGLNPVLKPGDMVLGEYLVQHDFDTTVFGDLPGLIPGLNVVKIPSSRDLTDSLALAWEKVKVKKNNGKNISQVSLIRGIIATGDQFISDTEVAGKIRKVFSADACEMEGGALAQVCAINGVDFAVLRAISDNGTTGAKMDYEEFKKNAVEITFEVLLEFFRDL